MEIELKEVGKKYGSEWVFKKVNLCIPERSHLAITGPNGSGKSTLLKVISTYTLPSKGSITFRRGPLVFDPDVIQLRINFVAPYLNLIEELTFREHLDFHSKFKRNLLSISDIITHANLPPDKLISEFSSGMKQRVKLCLAFFFEADCLFLDEPASNLDVSGLGWYQNLISENGGGKTILIASNSEAEYMHCPNRIDMTDLK